jgi:hypothetical protein
MQAKATARGFQRTFVPLCCHPRGSTIYDERSVMTGRFRPPVAIASAVGAFVGPCTVLAVAWATSFVACLDSTGTGACARKDLATVQLIVACVAFVPVLTLIYGVWVGRTRLAWLALGNALVIYAVWAILNDAATHGWDNMRLVPSVLSL